MVNVLRKVRRNASSILQDQANQIIEEWSKRVQQEIPSIRAQNAVMLQDSLPQFIQSLANVISTTPKSVGGERFADENREGCQRHGAERARIPQYTLGEVIQEYRILRQVILEHLEHDGPIAASERNKVLDAMDSGIAEAATEFAAIRGFPASRVSQAEAERNVAMSEAVDSRLAIDRMGLERDLRERFVSALTHDLRNPLTAAKMSAHLILRQADNADLSRRMAGRIIDDIERADQMIRDLLDANRIRAGEPLQLAIEQMDLVALVRETIFDLSTVHGDRFVLDSEASLVGRWSPKDLRRVIENLATNAVKYGDPHVPVTIKVFTRSERVFVSVHNEGNPIPSEVQAELFQQYHRAHSAQTSGQKGWGLGLNLALGIAVAHGGTIRLESSPERGTTFIVELPWVNAAAPKSLAAIPSKK